MAVPVSTLWFRICWAPHGTGQSIEGIPGTFNQPLSSKKGYLIIQDDSNVKGFISGTESRQENKKNFPHKHFRVTANEIFSLISGPG